MTAPVIIGDATLYLGDCLETLRSLPDESIQCCVTSPPYFGLRDYGTATWEGGDAGCDHVVGEIRTGLGMKALSEKYRGGGVKVSEPKPMTAKGWCPHCGALRVDRQIGLEPTPDEYVARLVAVFREVWRVLKDDSVCWINLGDSYAANSSYRVSPTKWNSLPQGQASRVPDDLKPKDMIGIPWRVAFALQADGWWLRQDIIWSKPNPMPESVTDRCTKAHEYLFLLAKSERYRYDADAIKEKAEKGAASSRFDIGKTAKHQLDRSSKSDRAENGLRNRRSVWTIPTKPCAEAHFAVMPDALVEPCILAGSRPGDTVLDPFNGSGTTGIVATRHGRRYVGIDLNRDYLAISERRLSAAQRQARMEFAPA